MEAAASKAIEAALKTYGVKREELSSLTLDGVVKNAGTVKGLDNLPGLESLSLVMCGINSLEGFPSLPALLELNLADNKVTSADGLKSLKEAAPSLQTLELEGCPLATKDGYRDAVFALLPHLVSVDGLTKDGEPVDDDDEGEEDDEEGDADDDADEGEEDEEDDDGLGTAFLVNGDAAALGPDDEFAEADEEEPGSEDIEDGEEEEDEPPAKAAKA